MTGAPDCAPLALLDAHHVGEQQTGNETWARNVVRALEDDGGRPVHYAVTDRGATVLPAPVEPSRLHRVSGSSSRRLLVDLPRILRSLRPDVVLTQYTLPPTRVPGAVVIHDLSFEHAMAGEWIAPSTIRRYRATIRWSARRARSIVVVSEWTRADLLAHYDVDPDRVVICPNVVDPQLLVRLTEAAAQRVVRPPADVVVLCVGGLVPRKNIPVVARAVVALRRQGLPATLRVVGGVGRAGAADSAMLSATLGDAVSFAGYVSEEQLVQEYRRATVLAYPSRFEGFGIPLLEAMAAGVPVVSSDATCLPEIGGDAALYAGPDDVEGWRATLARVIDDDALRLGMVDRGAARVAAYRPQDCAVAVRRALALAAG